MIDFKSKDALLDFVEEQFPDPTVGVFIPDGLDLAKPHHKVLLARDGDGSRRPASKIERDPCRHDDWGDGQSAMKEILDELDAKDHLIEHGFQDPKDA
jgi:hypothetical protein